MSKNKEYYDNMYIKIKERSTIWKCVAEYIHKDIGKINTLLDLGSGYGDFVNNYPAKTKYALDLSSEGSKYVNKNVKFHAGSCTDLSFIQSDTVDLVFASNLFEHLNTEELEKTVKEVRRVLRKNGKLVLLQPNFYYIYREYFHDYTHKTVFTHVSIQDFLEANKMSVIKIKPKFLPFSMQAKYSGKSIPKFLYIKPLINLYLYSPIKPFAGQMYIVSKK